MRLLLALLLAPTLLGAQITKDTVITFSGSRTVRLVPDHASFYVTVEGTAETAREAQQRAEGKLASVVAALRGSGSGIEMDAPLAFSLAPTAGSRNYPATTSSATTTVRTAMRVRIARIDELGNAVAVASDAGAASVGAISYESSQARVVIQAQTVEAVRDLREQANAIAEVLGGRISGLVDFVTTSQDRRQGYQPALLLPLENSGQQQNSPDVMLTINLTMRFRLSAPD